jgi:hypothetical protein
MANETVSAYVGEEIAELVTTEAASEDRNPGEFAAQAIRLFIRLPREARASFAALDRFGTREELRWTLNEIARMLNVGELEMSRRRIADQVRGHVPIDASEEELDRLAIEWTSPTP